MISIPRRETRSPRGPCAREFFVPSPFESLADRCFGSAAAQRLLAASGALLLGVACSAPPSPIRVAATNKAEVGAALERAAADLMRASPDRWAELVQSLRSGGVEAIEPLLSALGADANLDAPGREIAVGTLALLPPDRRIDAALLDELRAGRIGSAEAALGLGRRGNGEAVDDLAAVTADASRSTVDRTAAACALLELRGLRPRAAVLGRRVDGRDAGRRRPRTRAPAPVRADPMGRRARDDDPGDRALLGRRLRTRPRRVVARSGGRDRPLPGGVRPSPRETRPLTSPPTARPTAGVTACRGRRLAGVDACRGRRLPGLTGRGIDQG